MIAALHDAVTGRRGFHLSQTDVFLPMGGQLTAEFTRTYNSLDPAPSPYGRLVRLFHHAQ